MKMKLCPFDLSIIRKAFAQGRGFGIKDFRLMTKTIKMIDALFPEAPKAPEKSEIEKLPKEEQEKITKEFKEKYDAWVKEEKDILLGDAHYILIKQKLQAFKFDTFPHGDEIAGAFDRLAEKFKID